MTCSNLESDPFEELVISESHNLTALFQLMQFLWMKGFL